MTLIELIQRVGSDKLSRRLNVDYATVYSWSVSNSIPKPVHARAITKLFPDLISYEEIYEPYFQAQEKTEKDQQLSFED